MHFPRISQLERLIITTPLLILPLSFLKKLITFFAYLPKQTPQPTGKAMFLSG